MPEQQEGNVGQTGRNGRDVEQYEAVTETYDPNEGVDFQIVVERVLHQVNTITEERDAELLNSITFTPVADGKIVILAVMIYTERIYN